MHASIGHRLLASITLVAFVASGCASKSSHLYASAARAPGAPSPIAAGPMDSMNIAGDDGARKPGAEQETWKRSQLVPNTSRLMVGDREELPLRGMQTRVTIDGFRARVVTDYLFANDLGRPLEGTFQLRLPEEASPYFFAFGATRWQAREAWSQPMVIATSDTGATALPGQIMADRQESWIQPREARMVPREKAAEAYGEVVRQRVDDEDVAAGACEAGRRGERVLRACGVAEDAREDDEVGAAALRDLLKERRVVDLALAEAHVRQAPRRDPGAAAREAGRAAIDRDDALVERRQQRQQRALAGAGVDRERGPRGRRVGGRGRRGRALGRRAGAGEQRRQDREPGQQLDIRRGGLELGRLLEELPRQLLALRHDGGHPGQAAIARAEQAALLEGGAEDHVRGGAGAEQGPRAVAARREQARLAQRLRLLGDLRLALPDQRGELADGQLLLGAQGEQAQPILISEEPEQVHARRLHTRSLYSIMRMMASLTR